MHRRIRRWTVPVVLPAAIAAAAAGASTAHRDAPKTTAPATVPATAPPAAATGPSISAMAVRRAHRRAARAHARAAARVAARRRTRIVTRAVTSRIGRPYAFGAGGPGAFDCSGLTMWAMRRAGIRLPRTSFAQAGAGFGVRRSRIRAGDLVFFDTAGAGASHVGIATSRGSVVSATSHGVMEHPISSGYWSAHYVGARRIATAR